MEQKSLVIKYTEYPNNAGLDSGDKKLIEIAKDAAENAYAPYSQFKVGAALKLSNGEIISASNQENAAYPSGLCAERVALFYAHSQFPGEAIESLAVTSIVKGEQSQDPTYPCGACRQVIAETEKRGGKPIRIIIGGAKLTQVVNGSDSLLPFVFNNLPE